MKSKKTVLRGSRALSLLINNASQQSHSEKAYEHLLNLLDYWNTYKPVEICPDFKVIKGGNETLIFKIKHPQTRRSYTSGEVADFASQNILAKLFVVLKEIYGLSGFEGEDMLRIKELLN
jgi:hypothetical protein